MNFALVYLLHRFFYRFTDFFHHWYSHGTQYFFHGFLSALESLDRTFAVKITLRHFFEPLYKDYSVIGRILGVVFRSVRVALGTAVYAVVAAGFLLVYLVWIAIPGVILIYAFRNL